MHPVLDAGTTKDKSMAFVSTTITNTVMSVKGRGPKLDGYAMEIQAFAKAGGDTTGTVTATTLRRIHSILVTDTAGAAIAAVATITNSEAGFASVALTTLGAGSAGVVILKGSKK
jgi:hypothetical protein